jgi:hypothetical protein
MFNDVSKYGDNMQLLTKPPVRKAPIAISLGMKRPGREANRSPLITVEVRNA